MSSGKEWEARLRSNHFGDAVPSLINFIKEVEAKAFSDGVKYCIKELQDDGDTYYWRQLAIPPVEGAA